MKASNKEDHQMWVRALAAYFELRQLVGRMIVDDLNAKREK